MAIRTSAASTKRPRFNFFGSDKNSATVVPEKLRVIKTSLKLVVPIRKRGFNLLSRKICSRCYLTDECYVKIRQGIIPSILDNNGSLKKTLRCCIILSTCHFISLPIHQLAIVSRVCHFINLLLYQLATPSTCEYISLLFHQLAD